MSSNTAFLEHFSQLSSHYPFQLEAKANLNKGLAFPTTRDEYWKYTRIQRILDQEVAFNPPSVDSVSDYKIPGLDAYYVVLVNGLFQPQLSDNDPALGVDICSLSKPNDAAKGLIKDHLGKYISTNHQAFDALNAAFFQDGIFISVAKDAGVVKPICLLHISEGLNQASQVRHLLYTGENSKVQVIHSYAGIGNTDAFTNVATEVVAEKGASVALTILQNEGDGSKQVNTTTVHQKRDSIVTVVTLTQSGELVRNNLNFQVAGQGCTSNMYGVYFTSGKQHVDNHTYIDHIQPNCNSNELYKGVMADKSTGVFNGKIMVQRDAQKTNAFQSNQNILLSDSATINTKPELEIYADNVKCSHGCTIGQLDEEALFYLQSRGLSKPSATNLLVQAFAGEVTEKIEIEPLRTYAENFIHAKFAHLNA